MDTTTTIATAAPRTRSESSFMVPTGAEAFWRHADSHRSCNGAVSGIAFDVRTSDAVANTGPMLARDARTTAKQARPPREVPR